MPSRRRWESLIFYNCVVDIVGIHVARGQWYGTGRFFFNAAFPQVKISSFFLVNLAVKLEWVDNSSEKTRFGVLVIGILCPSMSFDFPSQMGAYDFACVRCCTPFRHTFVGMNELYIRWFRNHHNTSVSTLPVLVQNDHPGNVFPAHHWKKTSRLKRGDITTYRAKVRKLQQNIISCSTAISACEKGQFLGQKNEMFLLRFGGIPWIS